MARTATSIADDTKRARVLVIDDDPQIRSLLVAFLRRDYLVSVASEGAEGYEKALEHTPDIAVIDVQMPGWDGLKTLHAFRDHAALKGVRTVMLTADSSRQTVVAAISLGADDYIVKTALSKDVLLQKLKRVRALPLAAQVPITPSRPLRQPASSLAAVPATPATTLDEPRSAPLAGIAIPAMPESIAAGAATTAVAEPEVDPGRLQEMLDAWE